MQPDQHLHLHYSAPASEWTQALPLGNGRLGAMLHGRPTTELCQLNEDSVWYGGPQDRTPRDAFRHLSELRSLIRAERHREAEDLVRTAFFATPASIRHYEPLATCTVEFGHGDVVGYRRVLDLESAVHTVRYRHGEDVAHTRESFASFPDGVLLSQITSSEPIRFVVRMTRVGENECDTNEFLDSVHASDARIVLHATPGGRDSNRLCTVLGVSVSGGGSVVATGNCLVVQAESCIMAIGAHTTYRHADPELEARRDVDSALAKTWTQLVDAHTQDYASLFSRVDVRLWPDASSIPTDRRIKHLHDPGLVALYHNYGRYLLISSSRPSPKALPANLQGLWSPSFSPAWGGRYTTNVNLQMNYWPVGPSGLHECALPLLDLLERMAVRGRRTARDMYGCGGWCAHHNTDIWADTDPADRWMPSTLWPLGGVWLCVEAMDKLEYHWDATTLRRIAVLLEGSVEFVLDFLVLSADGKHLVTSPSVSPENTFVSADGSLGILCEGSTMDTSIVSMAFQHYLECHKNLPGQMRDDLARRVTDILHPPGPLSPRLPRIAVNADQLIQEWGLVDRAEHEPGHRHVSHLFGLYPGKLIHPDTAPALSAAARRVLERRASHGGGHTGWSRAWLLALHARLRDAASCGRHAEALLSGSTLPNLLSSHPPFQIDGNLGGCAAIAECLVQSKNARDAEGRYVGVHLLPACPAEWARGSVRDVRVSGWLALTFAWEEGKVVGEVGVVLMQASAMRIGLRVGEGRRFVWVTPGEVGEVLRVEAGRLYE